MSATGGSGIGSVLSLYRQVLRIHRDKLPGGVMRQLGNDFAKSEFGSHLKSPKTTKEQWTSFFQQWDNYLGLLKGNAPEVEAERMSKEMDSMALSEDQLKRMEELKRETMDHNSHSSEQPKKN
eukprot:gene14517-20547_t